ncbi:lipase [Vibrio sp. Sgm 22]|uniref:lipase n=1 Tax=unclassified Vibrio TaxID=2614977 RepID=UPI002249899A|nr:MULTISPECIES: lipase [unclassified Vibrio]MCX2757352.1 lipase [Vibrio sp. 14G-20]MCX2774106.1 lipase [Vibrio sp. Sgm 22]
MTTPVKCESYEGAVLKDFNKPYICGLITLALLGCQSEDSTQEAVSVLVPYNINELPKPNDGYGYDDDGTISGVGEEVAAMSSTNDAYYQDYNNSYAALDGWGLCAEPILIPLQSVNSDKRYPLNNETLAGNVVLIDDLTGEEVVTQISADGSNIKIQCESGLAESRTYSIVVTDGVKTEFNEPLKVDASFDDLIYSEVPLNNEKEEVLQEQVLSAIDSYYALYPDKGIPVYAAQFKTQSTYSPLDVMRNNHVNFHTKFLDGVEKVREFNSDYSQYSKKLRIPSYLPFTQERESECTIDEFDPKENCPPLYEWITNTEGGFPTAAMPEGVKKSPDVQRGIAETVIPDTCTTEATNQQCIEALRDFVALSTDNALLVSQLEDDIFDLVVTDLKQGVQATIDSADPASFISRQVAAEQPTLLLAAVGDCGETCDVGVDYVPDSVIPNTAPGNIRTGTEPLITALGLDPITGTSENINEKRGAVRTTTGGHGTYLFPYEGPVDENGLPGTPGENMSDVREAVDTQQIAVASMVMSDGAVVVINNEDHIETEVPQDEE